MVWPGRDRSLRFGRLRALGTLFVEPCRDRIPLICRRTVSIGTGIAKENGRSEARLMARRQGSRPGEGTLLCEYCCAAQRPDTTSELGTSGRRSGRRRETLAPVRRRSSTPARSGWPRWKCCWPSTIPVMISPCPCSGRSAGLVAVCKDPAVSRVSKTRKCADHSQPWDLPTASCLATPEKLSWDEG